MEEIRELLLAVGTGPKHEARERRKQLCDAAPEAIIDALADADEKVRESAAYWILARKDSLAIEPLINALKHDDCWKVRWQAAETLGKMGDKRAFEPLAKAFENGLVAAGPALGRLKDARAYNVLVKALENPDEDIRAVAIDGLMELEDERVPQLVIAALKDESKYVRMMTAMNIGNCYPNPMNSVLVAPLIDALHDHEDRVRAYAAHALGYSSDARAVVALMELLGSEDNELAKKWAIHSLGELGDEKATDTLVELTKHPQTEINSAAIWAYGKLKPLGASKLLMPFLNDEDAEIRDAAVRAFGELDDPSAIDVLIGMMNDADEEVRGSAVHGLSSFDDPRIDDILIQALSDEAESVRDQAAFDIAERKENL